MTEFNFDTLKNLPVPEDWIENALAIPEKEAQDAAVIPFWRNPRLIATAASLVLVSALSVFWFLHMGGNPPVAVKPVSDATEIVWSTDEHGATVATEIVIVPDGTMRQDGTEPSQTERGTIGSDPAASERVPDGTLPAESGRPAPTAGGGQPATAPAALPTQPAGHPPTGAPRPTAADPTEAPGEDPPIAEPMLPSESVEPNYKTTIEEGIYKPTYGITGSITVYCKIYDSDGNLYGDSDLFSEQHRAVITKNTASTLRYSYTPRDHGILPRDGRYLYQFYDETGRVLGRQYAAWLRA